MTAYEEKHNWLSYIVPQEWEAEAIEIRSQRDSRYGNIFPEENSDLRWVGDLGEICFNYWLIENGVKNFKWHLDNPAGKPDFTIADVKTEIKTVKRKVPPRLDYSAQITAQHKNTSSEQLFFLSYEFPIKKLWLLGGIKTDEFIKFAQYYGEGEFVHERYQVRKGHEIYNAQIDILISPIKWINEIKNI